MDYRLLRIKAVLGGVAIVLAGTFVVSFKFLEILKAGEGQVDGIFFPGAFFGACLTGSVIFVFFKLRRLKQLETYTRAWYDAEFPSLVLPNGVRCYRCKCSQHTVSVLADAKHHRAHACSNCGTLLYYSPTR